MLLLVALLLVVQDVTPEKCVVSGVAVHAQTGDPLNKVQVTLEPVDSKDEKHRVSTVTDAKGLFELKQVEAGSYRLRGDRNGFMTGKYRSTLKFDAGQVLKDLKLKLTPYSVLAGTVRDNDGEPLVHAGVEVSRVTMEFGRPSVQHSDYVMTDDLGQFRIVGVHPGRYYVSAEPPDGVGSTGHDLTIQTFYPGVGDVELARVVEVGAGSRVAGADPGGTIRGLRIPRPAAGIVSHHGIRAGASARR
jgi:5-hydroxyisourate hydrolase-like protein (transthyretin family)